LSYPCFINGNIERDKFLQLPHAKIETIAKGEGHCVFVTGEAGIGKSRLALELIKRTGLPDERIVVLQSSAQHQNTPLYPIIRTLE